ncbi:MAG: hypothetical protein ABTQ27_18015 [Amaricoccus sp.]
MIAKAYHKRVRIEAIGKGSWISGKAATTRRDPEIAAEFRA